jgi:acetolactate synthase-1/2/3 large subunit
MKLSDFVAQFISRRGVRHVFAISGGASVHLIQSIADTEGLMFVCPQHEQAGAMAADGYARVTGGLGVAVSTSGPGATNLLTGVACAYYDSIPTLFITGQVATFRSRGRTGVRQIGFQETDTIEIFRPVTKYAVRVDEPGEIRFELEKAWFLATEGRPGPVLIDIPDNIQREQVDPESLKSFMEPGRKQPRVELSQELPKLLDLLRAATRPVLILGAGVRLSKTSDILLRFIEALGFPVVPTWGAADMISSSHPLCVGTFGTHGTRYANFAVQNADLVLSVGARLDTKATGSPPSTFARDARKIVVDIDKAELGKFSTYGLTMDLLIEADAGDFMRHILPRLSAERMADFSQWRSRIRDWKRKYPACADGYFEQDTVNPYVLVKKLSDASAEGACIVVDTGCAVAWTMQAFDFKQNQRVLHDWNNTAMGWAVPASIAASFARRKGPVTCVVGDGSLLMNLQELATVARHALPIKIFLLNNRGYSMIRQTQDQWLGSKYLASSFEGGLSDVAFTDVARSFGIESFDLRKNTDVEGSIRRVLESPGPVLCNVIIDPQHRVVPQVKFGRPNEDSEPLLSRDEFMGNMLVRPLDISLKG